MAVRPILAPPERFISTLGRPPWRRSEIDVGRHLVAMHGAGWEDQVDFRKGERLVPPVMVGPDKIGSTRPEYYHTALCVAVEVKNWPIDRLTLYAGQLRLQMAQRRWSVPTGTDHWIFFDLRGQRVGSLEDLAVFVDKLFADNQIECDEVHFVLDATVVRAL